MEFFERAHVANNKATKRKESKSEETVKRQLKQMLHGYKQSDNELIMKSLDSKQDAISEESSSVSGFSDLNITNSSSDDNTMQINIESHLGQDTLKSDDSATDISSLSLSGMSDINSLNATDSSNQNIEKNYVHIDQYSDPDQSENESAKSINLDSDSNNFSHSSKSLSPEIRNFTLSDISEDFTRVSSAETTELESDNLEPFDADGILASKILKKLKKYKIPKKKLKDKNRQSNIVKEYTDSNETPILNSELKDKSRKKLSKCDDNLMYVDDEDYVMSDEKSDKDPIIGTSSPFLLVTADETCNQSLNEILGDYRFPTIRNISSDSQNITLPIDNCELTELLNDDEVHIEEAKDENDSLISELDQEQTLNDVELEISSVDEGTQPIEESMDLYDTLQSEQTFERESSQESIDTTFVSPVKVFYGENKCIMVLKHPATVFIHGKVIVSALGGTVETFGWTLKDEPHELYAPNYNHAQIINTVENQNAYYGLFGKLTSAGLSVAEAEEIVTMIGEQDGIIKLQQLNSKKIDFVENSFTETNLFSKQAKDIDISLKNASEVLGCSVYLNRPWKCFDKNPIWEQVIKCGLNKASRGIVCGGKGTGKSTFLRYYVNKLLQRGPVLVVDLDPGQCEFTVAGNLSATVVSDPLLGPNFTHLKTPDKMLNIGMINTTDNSRRYAAAVQSLIAHCRSNDRFRDMPWIVNTMGMCNTLGLKFITLCVLCTEPTFLLQIDSRNAKKRYGTHLNAQTIRKLYFENCQSDPLFRNLVCPDYFDYDFFLTEHSEKIVKNNPLSPREERYLNFLAYFGEMLNVHKETNLLAITPYEVPLRSLNIGLNVKIDEDALVKVINGKVIALCQLERHPHETQGGDNRGRMFTLADKPLLCHGHGLVRGIDCGKGMLYIATPAPAERLSLVDALVYADWAPELCGPEAPLGAPVPYRAASRHHRQLMFTPRRRFNPLQLLKMTRTS